MACAKVATGTDTGYLIGSRPGSAWNVEIYPIVHSAPVLWVIEFFLHVILHYTPMSLVIHTAMCSHRTYLLHDWLCLHE